MFKDVRDNFLIYQKYSQLVYLDSGATSLTPKQVVDNISDYYNYYRSTVNRGESPLVNYNNQRYEQTRHKVANLLGCNDQEVIFGKSTTSLMNHIARNIIEHLNQDDEIIISELEHHSTLLSFRERARDKNIKVNLVKSKNNTIDLDDVFSLVSEKTKVIVMHHVSNVIGDTINIKRLGQFCKKHNIICVIDGAQGILHEAINVKDWGIDFYVFSAHKVFGPTGLGVMYGNEAIIKDYYFDYGGDMAYSVDEHGFVPKPLPHRLEAGTPNIAEVISFSESVDFINRYGIENIYQYNLSIRNYCLAQLQQIDEVTIYNQNIETTLIVFNIDNVSIHDAQGVFAKHDIALRGGQMCNALSVFSLDTENVLRVSFNIYNTREDVDKFIEVVKLIIKDPLAWM